MTRKKKPVCKECKGWGIPNLIDYRIEPCPACGVGKAGCDIGLEPMRLYGGSPSKGDSNP